MAADPGLDRQGLSLVPWVVLRYTLTGDFAGCYNPASRNLASPNFERSRGGAVWQLVGLITRRS
jgi:hypothetical protein